LFCKIKLIRFLTKRRGKWGKHTLSCHDIIMDIWITTIYDPKHVNMFVW